MSLSIPDQEKVARAVKNVVNGYPCTDKEWIVFRELWSVKFAQIDHELDKLGFEIVRKKP